MRLLATLALAAPAAVANAISPSSYLRGGAQAPTRKLQMSEVAEYAASSGRLDPHVVHGHDFDSGNVADPHYETLGPSPIAVMGPEIDIMANPAGVRGVGPGGVTMGIKDQQVMNGEHGPTRKLQMSEVAEYAASSDRLDPHVLHGHDFDSGGIASPGYNSLGPSHVAVMGPDFDALGNPVGTHGVGPGSVAMGITLKDQQV